MDFKQGLSLTIHILSGISSRHEALVVLLLNSKIKKESFTVDKHMGRLNEAISKRAIKKLIEENAKVFDKLAES